MATRLLTTARRETQENNKSESAESERRLQDCHPSNTREN